MKKVLLSILIILAVQPYLWGQANIEEFSDESKFEQKHKRPSKREDVRIKGVMTYKSAHVYQGNWEKRVELIGVELPELGDIMRLVDNGEIPETKREEVRRTYWKASQALSKYAEHGDILFIEKDAREKNAFGNILVYLYSPNRRVINIELVRQGYAFPVYDLDNNRYEGEFREALQEAIDHRRGLYQVWQVMYKDELSGATQEVNTPRVVITPKP